MESIVFFIALVGVIYVVIWAISNDEVDDDSPTEGLLRMKQEKSGPDKKGEK